MFKSIIAITVMIAASAASAATAGNADAAIAPAKKELVHKVLQLWQVDALGESMLERPVAEAVAQARAVLQGRVPQDKQDAAMKDITAEARKFLEANGPLVRDNTNKIVPSTIEPMLAEKFSEDELRQIISIFESPVKRKFEAMVPDMQKALGEKLAAETRSQIDPKLEDLRQRIASRLRAAAMP
ncbi:MAG TPA: DUF2059 domain-containing protein [Noviherbaspirillum sp.]|uniref:DUF2059 domain-containing protein n=1 Tax=Noviherbaspirillum sp. TaxID=1926288 RepID=UPI002B46325F|nr:DUF2059 domain-containing protein [Noviherbaspirillum sp.]HJV86201.1 DUF2059 domain-containing protein [Noviherbaspirillum sp.]